MADLLNDVHLVGDDHHGDPQFLVELLQQGQDGQGGGGVQGRGGLVAQQHLGAGGQGPGDGHPLLLPAGELGGVGPGPVSQAHQVQQFLGPFPGLGALGADELQGEADVVQGGALHEQVKALEDHADALPGPVEVFGGELGHLLPVHHHGAGRGPLQQVHAPHQGGLARPGQADDAKDLPRLDGQVDVLQGVDRRGAGPEGFVQMLDLNDRFTHGVPPLFSVVEWGECGRPAGGRAKEKRRP